MKRMALIANSVVENIALWDGESPWEPEGYILIDVSVQPAVAIGDGWDESNGVFISPVLSEPDRPVPSLADVLEGIFLEGIRQFAAIVPASVRGQLFILKAAGVEALKAGDIEATKALIEEAQLPQDAQVEAIRAEMLGRFPNGE